MFFLVAVILCASALHAAPPQAGSGDQFAPIDAILQNAVETHAAPGAVCLIGHNGQIVYRKAFGWRSLEPRREPMTVDTIFDLASLTKPIATATSLMRLVELGQVGLNDPVAAYLPEFKSNGKQDITLRMLLTHFSGLPPDLDLKQPWQGKDAAFRMAMDSMPIFPPGQRFLYSDVNYLVLGFLVERVSGLPLNQYAAAHIFQPLGMATTRFLPPAEWLPLIAPTAYDENNRMLRGLVHDPTARRMGGVAGHAGLFSTADDLAKFAQEFISGNRILSRLTIEKMTTPQQPANSTSVRGLGWDLDSPFSSNRGALLPVGSYGHTGFTGTSLWIDPVTDTYIILLANAVHPRGGQSLVSLRERVATAVAAALELTIGEQDQLRLARITGYNESAMAARRIAVRNGTVRNGIDVLEARNFDLLAGPPPRSPAPKTQKTQKRRIGLVTNQTGLDAAGRRTIDLLAHLPGIELAAIFSPEHGLAGQLDTTAIANGKDAATGIPVYSLYGDTDAKRRPPPEVINQLDAVVYDIQDVGTRYYTYESTLGYLLEAAARAGREVIVLDRPNPITGAFVQGPVADQAQESFLAYHQIPVRHGMTIGELARMFNAERNLKARLTVVPMEGWQRGDWFDSTGRLWTNPSPNMRSLTEATLYPGVGLIEGTNVSVGRGTDTPFEVVGAPWIKPQELAAYLNERLISGVRFVPVTFTPTASRYRGRPCGGVNIVVLDRNAIDGPELGLELASALYRLYPGQYSLDKVVANGRTEQDGLMPLLANRAAFDALKAGQDPRRIALDWMQEDANFEQRRQRYLLYP